MKTIWITGDTHGNWIRRLNSNAFPEQKDMTKDDYVIICGDFGLWHDTKDERYRLDWLEKKPFTTLFVDGNHSNFDRLNAYSVEEWNGGKVHKIRPSVIHLMRGEVFNLHNKTFFAFGGASSHDISDGILDSKDKHWSKKAEALEKQGKYMYRIKGLSWWEEELPSDKEMNNGLMNLEKNNWNVDYIITHSPSASILALLGAQRLYEQDKLTQYLQNIRVHTEYKRHFRGHMHINKAMNEKDILLYEQIVRIL